MINNGEDLPRKQNRDIFHKQSLLFLLSFIVLIVLYSYTVNAVPSCPFPQEAVQADGTKIIIIARGDEFFSWIEDENGYVIAYDSKTNNWCYAYISDGKILPGPVVVRSRLGEQAPSESVKPARPRLTRDDLQQLRVKVH